MKLIKGIFLSLLIFICGFSFLHVTQAEGNTLLDYSVNKTFNGSSDFMDKTADLSSVKSLDKGSILVKFKTTTKAIAKTFLSASATKDPSSNLSLTMNNGNIYFENRQDGVYATKLTASGSFNDGNWHTAILTVGDKGTKIYVDGNEMGSDDSTAFFTNVKNLNGMWIGRNVDNNGGEWYYQGNIKTLKIYSKPLTSEEVKALSDVPTNGFFHEKILFNNNDGKGYAQYRIPSITVTSDGTILAVAEARTGDDQTPTDLVLKRSTDDGKTFSKQVILAPGATEGHAEMNPMLLAEDNSQTVHLLWSRWEWGNCQYFIRTSNDNGRTWGKTRNITSVLDVYDDPDNPNYFPDIAGAGMGPGHGFQMSNGTLIVPIYLTKAGWSNSTVAYIYSTDDGKTWNGGPKVPNPTGFTQIHENMMVETSDGGLMANMRNPGSDFRAISRSAGVNESWSTPTSDKKLIDPVNEASLAKYDDHTILFTNAANKTTRTNMTVRLTKDDGKTWYASKEIYGGTTGYSDIFVSPDKTINMLYEKPATTKIAFAQFNKDWILGKANIQLETPQQIEHNETTTIKTTFTNHSNQTEHNVTLKLKHPQDWTIKPTQSTTFDKVEPGKSVHVTWDVTPNKNATSGNYKLTALATFTINDNETNTATSEHIQLLPKIPTKTAYLSDLGWVSTTNGWGPVERDMSVGGNGENDGQPITIGGQTFDKGLGVHANSKIVYHIGGNFSHFKASIGVDDEMSESSPASVVFQVFGDGNKLYDSGTLTAKDKAKAIDVPIKNVNTLTLVVTDSGNGNGSDHADWADAKIIASHQETDLTIKALKTMVEDYAHDGAFKNDHASQQLLMQLKAIMHYEKKQETDKVVKHLNGLSKLLDHQHDTSVMTDDAYQALNNMVHDLVNKWQKKIKD